MQAVATQTPIAALSAAVDALAEERADGRSTHALAEDLVALHREIDRLEAQLVRRLHLFDRTGGANAEHSPNTVEWLRGACGLTAAAAADRVRMARALDELPQVAASFQAGDAPFANVSLIGRLADTVGCEATRTVEGKLVAAAESATPGDMFRVVTMARHALDAVSATEQELRNHERRRLTCEQTFDGMFALRGELDREGGAIVRTALDALCKPHGPDDARSGGQRRADALVDIAAAMLRIGDLPSVHGQRPHLVLTASVDALRGAEGAAPAEIVGAGPVPVATARRLACDASVRVVQVPVDGGDSSPSSSSASRKIPAPKRVAMDRRDGGCRFGCCQRPAAWTDGHHVRHWVDDGPTEVPNLVSLCRYHHRVVHELGATIRFRDDGGVDVVGPDGTVIASEGRRLE